MDVEKTEVRQMMEAMKLPADQMASLELAAYKPVFELNKSFDDTIAKMRENQKKLENKEACLDMCTFVEEKNNGKQEIKIAIGGCADFLMMKYPMVTFRDDCSTWYFHDSFYRKDIESLIKREVSAVLKTDEWNHDILRTGHIKEILMQIQAKTFFERAVFEPPLELVPCINGILDITTGEMVPYMPSYFFHSPIGASFLKDATCPAFLKFLSEIIDAGDIPLIQEMFGYCLYRKYLFHKAFMLLGGGSNGKSTLLNVLKVFLGSGNHVDVALQSIEENRFSAARLVGKMACISDDLSDRALQSTGTFKQLTGESSLGVEQKFREGFDFLNYAKLIYSANKLPETNDITVAFFRRWAIVNFSRVFNAATADPKMFEKITTEEELSGILNWALVGLQKLLQTNLFSAQITPEEMEIKYQKLSSSLIAFLYDCVVADSDNNVSKEDFYNAYTKYCSSTHTPPKTKDWVGKHLPRYSAVTEMVSNQLGARIRAWKGIRLLSLNERVVNPQNILII